MTKLGLSSGPTDLIKGRCNEMAFVKGLIIQLHDLAVEAEKKFRGR